MYYVGRDMKMSHRGLGIDERDWAPAVDFPDAEVAEAAYAPEGWEHEPLRLVARRVAFAAEGLASDPRARRRRSIPRAQLSLVDAGEATTAYGYSFCLCRRFVPSSRKIPRSASTRSIPNTTRRS